MAKGDVSSKDKEMAKHMKDRGNNAFPDSVSRPWRGAGFGDREMAKRMAPRREHYNSTFERGMLGGLLAHKLGFTCSVFE